MSVALGLLGVLAGWFIARRYSTRGSRETRVVARGIEKLSKGAPVEFARTPDGGLVGTREERSVRAEAWVVDAPDDPTKKPL